MLPSPQLRPAYDRVTWLYVCRDFSDSQKDRAADRIMLRFGLTSYPHLLLVDPSDWKVLEHIGRTQEQFLGAVTATHQIGREGSARSRYQAAERLAASLEERRELGQALSALNDEDIVVRTRALEVVAEKRPADVAARAEKLLACPSDPYRFQVLEVLQKHGDERLARALDRLLQAPPEDSANPNVLRCQVAAALARCGDARSIQVLAPFALTCDTNNGLTGEAVLGLAGIGTRHREVGARVAKILVQCFPKPGGNAESLARKVHSGLVQLTGKKVDFPRVYDNESREVLRLAW